MKRRTLLCLFGRKEYTRAEERQAIEISNQLDLSHVFLYSGQQPNKFNQGTDSYYIFFIISCFVKYPQIEGQGDKGLIKYYSLIILSFFYFTLSIVQSMSTLLCCSVLL